jgi:transposase-like protein
MASSRRTFPRAFKVRALKRLETGDSVGEVAQLYKIDPNLLRRWRWEYETAPESAFPGPGRHPSKIGIAELQRRIERHTQEIDYLTQRIQSAEAQSMPQASKSATTCS